MVSLSTCSSEHLDPWPLLFRFQIYTLGLYIRGFHLLLAKDFSFPTHRPISLGLHVRRTIIIEESQLRLSCFLVSLDSTDRRPQAFLSASRQDWYIFPRCSRPSFDDFVPNEDGDIGIQGEQPRWDLGCQDARIHAFGHDPEEGYNCSLLWFTV